MLTIWAGGMPEVYWLGAQGELKGEIHSQHMPLGILADDKFDASSQLYNVAPGDKLYFYSDGITESCNKQGEMFGHQRLKQALLAAATGRFDSVLQSFKSFTDVRDQSDDITLVELTCAPIPAVQPAVQQASPCGFSPAWTMNLTLTEKEIRDTDPVTVITEMLAAMPPLNKHRDALQILLSEMYCNALEHSIMGMESITKSSDEGLLQYYRQREAKLQSLTDAAIEFEFSYLPDATQPKLVIRISDNGSGFREERTACDDESFFGRGLEIIGSLCESMAFSDGGKSFQAIYKLSA
jgi:hypothetical protein